MSTTATAEGVSAERTVAFFADPRAALILLEGTVGSLIEARGIERGLVDLSTLPGLAIARAFRSAGVPFDVMEYGQEAHLDLGRTDRDPIHAPVIASDAENLRAAAESTVTLDVAGLGAVDANIVVVPAMVADGEKLVDFSQGSLVGAVLTQLEAAQRDLMLIDTPERGLRRMPDGAYQRAIIHVASSAEPG